MSHSLRALTAVALLAMPSLHAQDAEGPSRLGFYGGLVQPLGPWSSSYKLGYGLGLQIRFGMDRPESMGRLRMDYFASDSKASINPTTDIPRGRDVRFEGYGLMYEWTPTLPVERSLVHFIFGVGGTNLHRTDRYTSLSAGPQTATQSKLGAAISAGFGLSLNDHCEVELRAVHVAIADFFSAGEYGRNRDRVELGVVGRF